MEEMNAHILLAAFCRNALWNGMNGDRPPALPPGYEPGEVILAGLVHQLRCHDLAHGDGSAEAPLRRSGPTTQQSPSRIRSKGAGTLPIQPGDRSTTKKRKFKCLRIALRAVFHDRRFLGNRGFYSMLLAPVRDIPGTFRRGIGAGR